jgi:hypothetical protein
LLFLLTACASKQSEPVPLAPEPRPTIAVPPAPTATASEPPAPTSVDAGVDREAELEWLRTRVPSLAGLREGAPAADLLSWVAEGGSVDLWVTADQFRCAAAKATRTPGSKQLALSIVESESGGAGRRTRQLMGGYAGQLLTYGSNGSTERQRPDGSWTSDRGWGRSGGTVAGALLEVDAERASFEGRAVYLQIICPKVDTPCASGGSRPCVDCSAFEVYAHPLMMHGGYGRASKALPKATCTEPCVPSDPTDKNRAADIIAALKTPLVEQKDPAVTALYRSLSACKADLTNAKK